METKPATLSAPPPRLIGSITSGFNTVASHLYLVLFPIALDLLLWFGPHLRVKALLEPFLKEFGNNLMSISQPEMKAMLQGTQQIWQVTIEHFNLFNILRGFPVGVPSLMSAIGPLKNPLGQALMLETPSLGAAVTTAFALGLVGLLLGSLYFRLIARIASADKRASNLGGLGWESFQALLLFIIMVIIALVTSLPIFLFLSVLAMLSPFLTQVALLLVTVLLIWLLMPLVFSPHGIFVFQLNALRSTLLSYRLIRFFLPGTGLFLLIAILISEGLDVLWRVPPEDSWMALVGILGHAFISTSLLAASFIYYVNGVRWMQAAIQQRTEASGVRI